MARKSVLDRTHVTLESIDTMEYVSEASPRLDIEQDIEMSGDNGTQLEQVTIEIDDLESEALARDKQQVVIERYLEALVKHNVQGYQVSNETFNLITTTLNLGVEAVADEGLLKTVGKALIALMVKAGELLKKAYQHIKASWPLVVTNITKLKADVKEAKLQAGKLTGNETLELSSASSLSIGGNFVGDSYTAINAVSQIARDLLVSVPKELIKLLDDSNYTKTLGNKETVNKLIAIHANFNRSDVKRLYSKVMPGDKLVTIAFNHEAEYSSVTYKVEDSDTPTGNHSYKVEGLDGSTASSVLSNLEKLLGTIEEYSNGLDSMSKSLIKRSLDEVKDLKNLSEKDRSPAYYGSRLTAMRAARAYMLGNQRFCGYCITLVKHELSLINNLIKLIPESK